MAPKGAKLRDALNRYQGKDHKLEKQKKLQKEAAKRKSAKHKSQAAGEADNNDDEDNIEGEAELGGVLLNGAQQDSDGEDGASEEWESEDGEDEDEDEQLGLDISRLNEIESESDSDSEDDGQDEEAPGLVPAPNAALEPEDEQDIPLSDLSDASDAEDIIPHQRLTINNTTALQRALSSFALPLKKFTFSEHQCITTSDPVQIADVEDELNRELSFYSQALSSAKEARSLLRNEGVPFTRPNDYFAEMVKSDEHMGKIKAKLLDEAASKKASQDARRQRELKKFGKQVQMEKLKERAKQKKDMLDKVKILKRKRQSSGVDDANEDGLFDVALEDAATTERKAKDERRAKMSARGGKDGQRQPAKNAKRQKRDETFGFGGKKRFKKSGDAASSSDMTGFSTNRMKGQAPGKKAGPKRLGKSRRAKMK